VSIRLLPCDKKMNSCAKMRETSDCKITSHCFALRVRLIIIEIISYIDFWRSPKQLSARQVEEEYGIIHHLQLIYGGFRQVCTRVQVQEIYAKHRVGSGVSRLGVTEIDHLTRTEGSVQCNRYDTSLPRNY
jgi:hypothetical protein